MFIKSILAIIFGVFLGIYAALILSFLFFPLIGTVDAQFMAGVIDSHHQIYPETREVMFYRLSVILGFCFGMLGAFGRCFIVRFSPIVISLVPLVLSLNLAMMWMIRSTGPGDFYTAADAAGQFSFKAFLSALPFAVIFVVTVVAAMLNPTDQRYRAEGSLFKGGARTPRRKMNFPSWFKYAAVLAVLIVLLLPRSNMSEDLGLYDYHRPTFFIGPALYQMSSDKLVPGKDFSVQYGLGQSFVSALFLGKTLPDTLVRLNMLHAGVKIFFFFCLFVFCVRFLRNTFYAVIVVFSALALQVLTYALPDGRFTESTLIVPSVGAYRHAFVPLVWLFALEFFRRPKSVPVFAALCALIGASLFWVNDTGIGCLVTTAGLAILRPYQSFFKNLLSAAAIVIFSLASFALLGVLVYGPSFASVNYAEMFKYMRLFASGYASVKAHWSFHPLDLIMHIISNVVIVSTIVFAFLERRKVFARFLLLIALFAAMIKLKFINQTSSQHFFGDIYPLLIIAGYWLNKILPLRPGRNGLQRGIILFVVLLLTFDAVEAHRGIHAGIRSYWNSPQTFVLPGMLKGKLRSAGEDQNGFTTSRSDRDLIEKYIPAGQRVFLVSYDDVAYLLESRRAPGSPFVPMMDIVFTKNMDDFYRNALKERFVFIDYRALNAPLAKVLLAGFDFKEKAQYLLLLENKNRDNSLLLK